MITRVLVTIKLKHIGRKQKKYKRPHQIRNKTKTIKTKTTKAQEDLDNGEITE